MISFHNFLFRIMAFFIAIAFSFNLQAQAPANDNLANAVVIESLPFSNTLNTEGATNEANESISSCSVESNSVWYRYTPAEDQNVRFSTAGSDYDTILTVWTGITHPLTEFGCNDDSKINGKLESTSQVSLALEAGTTYYIRVTGVGEPGNTGMLILTAQAVQPDLEIVQQPADQTVNFGTSAILSIEVKGEEPVYQWYAGERGDTSAFVGTNTNTYTTPKLQAITRYWVRVSNANGTVDSRTITVQVAGNANGVGVAADGSPLTTQANFAGEIRSTLGQRGNNLRLKQDEFVTIESTISIDPVHITQIVDIVMVGAYSTGTSPVFFMRDTTGSWQPWDLQISSLNAGQTDVRLTSTVKATIFRGTFKGLPGRYTVYTGYRLSSGEVFYGNETINFVVEN